MIAPGEEHWHGATPDRFMAHVALNEADEKGEVVTWLEPVDDADYRLHETRPGAGTGCAVTAPSLVVPPALARFVLRMTSRALKQYATLMRSLGPQLLGDRVVDPVLAAQVLERQGGDGAAVRLRQVARQPGRPEAPVATAGVTRLLGVRE